MSMSIHVTLAAVVSLVVVASPKPAEARPCTCDDVADIKASIAMIKKTRRAWYSVLVDIQSNSRGTPKTGAEAKLAFQKYMGWTSVREVGGLSQSGDIVVDEEYQEEHCEIVIEGVRKHESAHYWYFVSRFIPIAMSSQRNLAVILAKSEIDSRNVQIGYLIGELKDLMKSCGREYTPDPPPLRIQWD